MILKKILVTIWQFVRHMYNLRQIMLSESYDEEC